MRVRRSLAVAVVVLASLSSVSWGASASAAPAQHHPVLVKHVMSSCGAMDGTF